MGVCKASNLCTVGKVYSGLCPGAANLKCCIPPATRANSGSGAAGGKNRPKITQTTLVRLSEKEHLAKWARFKTMRRKTYATAAKDKAAYLVFRANRVRIIYLNDRYGAGYVVWASTAPFTDVPSSTFAMQRMNARLPAPGSRSFLELEADQDLGVDSQVEAAATAEVEVDQEWLDFQDLALSVQDNDLASQTIDEQHTASLLEAESQVDAEADAEAEADASAEVAVGGAKACVQYGRPGFCRQQYTCRTKMEYASNDCPASARCCLGDKDDLGDDTNNIYTDGPVSPKVIGPGGAKITGTFSVDWRQIMTPVRDQGQCGRCVAHSGTHGITTHAVRLG
jgi:hypothetical protein